MLVSAQKAFWLGMSERPEAWGESCAVAFHFKGGKTHSHGGSVLQWTGYEGGGLGCEP